MDFLRENLLQGYTLTWGRLFGQAQVILGVGVMLGE